MSAPRSRALPRPIVSSLSALTAALLASAASAAPQCTPDVFEPNDLCAQAAPLGAGNFAGLTATAGEPDFFRVSVPASHRLEVRLHVNSPSPDTIGLFSLFQDDGSASPCDVAANQLASALFCIPQTDVTLGWSAPKHAAAAFIVELSAFNAACTDYDLDVLVVPDPCSTVPDDVFEGNDDCASAVALSTGTFLGLNVGINDPDFYSVTAGPGELLSVSASGLSSGEQAMLLAWEQGQNCPSPTNFTNVAIVFAQSTGGMYLFNPSLSSRTFVVQIVPTPNQALQAGFCLQYSLSVTAQFNPCDLLAGDPFEPNSLCDNPPVLSGSQTGLKISGWFEQDWYTVDVPAHSTLRLQSTSSSPNLAREMMLFKGCSSTPQDFLASSNPPFFNPADKREWLVWSNAGSLPVSTRLFMLNNGMSFPNPFCDVYDLEMAFTLGTPFCPPTTNSTGGAALLSASGSTTVGQGTLELSATPVPPNSIGLVFFGNSHNIVTPFGGGLLCVGGPLLRLPASSTGAGTLHTTIDWTGTSALIPAGESRSFQAWFRDPSANPTFDLSEGLQLDFQ
jgi:hypothetical protein